MTSPDNKKLTALLICSVFAAGFLLRVLMLDSLPPALFRDEAEKALNGWHLSQNLRDINGHFLPIFIEVMGVTTSAIYQYACVPFMWLLGPDEWSARLPAVCAAMLALWFNFLFMRRAFGLQTALIATLMLAMSPWHIVFSRWAQQGIFLPMFASLGLWSAVYWHQTRRCWALTSAAICAGLMVYTYDVARLFVPILGLCSVLIWRHELLKSKRDVLIATLAGGVTLAPVIWLMLFKTDAAQARFSYVSIFKPGADFGSVAEVFFRNYLNHWSLDFLLLHGDAELRHGARTGVLNIVEFAGLIAFVIWALKTRNKTAAFWTCWLLLWPVASSLTRIGVPHALRSIVSLPGIQDAAALGWVFALGHVPLAKQKSAMQILCFSILAGFSYFAIAYYSPKYYRWQSSASWQYGVKQCIEFVAPYLEQIPKDSKVVFYNFQGADFLVPYYSAEVLGKDSTKTKRASELFVFPKWNARFEEFADNTTAPLVVVQPLDMQHFPALDGGLMPLFGPGGPENRQNLAASIRWNSTYETIRQAH